MPIINAISKALRSIFRPWLNFIMIKGGVTWDRKTVIANTKQWICGKVKRELLPASFKVYPIKDYMARLQKANTGFANYQRANVKASPSF